jgi:predicted Zn-dependent protease
VLDPAGELGAGFENRAIEAFKAAVRLRPFWAAAHGQLGLAHAAADRCEEAVEAMSNLSDSDPMTSVLWQRWLKRL